MSRVAKTSSARADSRLRRVCASGDDGVPGCGTGPIARFRWVVSEIMGAARNCRSGKIKPTSLPEEPMTAGSENITPRNGRLRGEA